MTTLFTYTTLFRSSVDEEDDEGKPAYASLSKDAPLAIYVENNVYFNSALAYKKEKGAKLFDDSALEFTIDRDNKKVVIDINKPELLDKSAADIIDTDKLGLCFHTEQLFEKPYGTPYRFDTDFESESRGKKSIPGPFQVTDKKQIELSFK